MFYHLVLVCNQLESLIKILFAGNGLIHSSPLGSVFVNSREGGKVSHGRPTLDQVSVLSDYGLADTSLCSSCVTQTSGPHTL